MGPKIRILVVDDSVVYRTQIKDALRSYEQMEVVAVASNGQIAVERLNQIEVDLIILDLEMPVQDGIETLKELRRRKINARVVVFSSVSRRGAEIALEALSLGAVDFVTKPDNDSTDGAPKEKIRVALEPKLRALFPMLFKEELPSTEVRPRDRFPQVAWDRFQPRVVVIGSSTGGPTALEIIFSELRGPFRCPIVIAQHMPPLFTMTLIERLGKLCGVVGKEAQDGEVLENKMYIAPGDYHLRLKRLHQGVQLSLSKGEAIHFVRPAVDPLFESASHVFGGDCLGIVLTGMGQDGKQGSELIKKGGGAVIIQERSSCVVFGMPGAVYAAGAYDRIESPQSLAQLLKEKIVA